MASDCGPTRKRPSSQKGPSPPQARAQRPVGGENWSFQGTVQLLCGCVPRSQDFQEIEPVPCALGNNSPRQHFGIPGYPEAARDFSSSPAPGLLTLCSRLRAKPDSVCLPFFPPREANATPTRLCLRVSLAGEGKPTWSREEDGAAISVRTAGPAPDKELPRSPGVWELECVKGAYCSEPLIAPSSGCVSKIVIFLKELEEREGEDMAPFQKPALLQHHSQYI
ncbi:PREDICTED: uncharacterized protein LOC105533084 [Mandrillus leucophaeus]|uniref:uncharacterized protein LOC105533084 n=1 Tax=Mandrillus leucophaeus TaxID=9568 RepID=UPI0005F4C4F1|nr:PREDICTED: uncharacterized protein LOC105533084 [Mandrillus leucophaeus]